jgi:phosphoribosylglycinamide formyltransferase-1
MKKLGILLSGRGSNFEAIAAAVREGRVEAEIAVVISNKPAAPGLERAKELGIPAESVPSKGTQREEYDRRVASRLKEYGVDLICLAGFMRLLSAGFVEEFQERIVNIHPSLLPAFPGLDAQAQALEHGVRYAGCTVHFVDEQLDSGPIIAQAVVAVLDDDDEHTLSARILKEEHRIYPEAIQTIVSGDYRIVGRRVFRGQVAS